MNMIKTLYSTLFVLLSLSLFGQVIVKDGDVGEGTTNWTAENEYHLDGYVFVDNGANYRSHHFSIVCAKLNIALINVSPHNFK